MRNKIPRSTNAKYHYSYLFFYKMNKGDLPFMYSCVFWCEFIFALVKKIIYITHSYRESGTPVLGEAILDLVKKKSAS